jgi:hypothetical protein
MHNIINPAEHCYGSEQCYIVVYWNISSLVIHGTYNLEREMTMNECICFIYIYIYIYIYIV